MYRMAYPFVGVPVFDILHHGYTTDVVSVKVSPAASNESTKEQWEARMNGQSHS